MTNSNLVQRTDCDGVAVVILNAPESINALSEAMLQALSAEFDRIAEDRAVKAVILRSAGKHFCAGHNLKEMTARREDADGGFQYFQDLFATCSSMMQRIVNLHREVRMTCSAAGAMFAALSGMAGRGGCWPSERCGRWLL